MFFNFIETFDIYISHIHIARVMALYMFICVAYVALGTESSDFSKVVEKAPLCAKAVSVTSQIGWVFEQGTCHFVEFRLQILQGIHTGWALLVGNKNAMSKCLCIYVEGTFSIYIYIHAYTWAKVSWKGKNESFPFPFASRASRLSMMGCSRVGSRRSGAASDDARELDLAITHAAHALDLPFRNLQYCPAQPFCWFLRDHAVHAFAFSRICWVQRIHWKKCYGS